MDKFSAACVGSLEYKILCDLTRDLRAVNGTNVWDTTYQVIHAVIPEPQNRTLVSIWSSPHILMAFWPVVLMGYLVRRPNTHLLRVALVLPTILVLLRASYAFVWTPALKVYDFGLSLAGLAAIAKVLEFAFLPEGRQKIGEDVAGTIEKPAIDATPAKIHELPQSLLPRPLADAFEVVCAARGLGWEFGKTMYIPHETRPVHDKSAFLQSCLRTFLLAFLALDFIESCMKLSLTDPSGSSIFDPSLSPIPRYALSTFLHTCTGLAFIAGFNMVYYLFAFIFIRFLNHSPTSWPPIFDAPWYSESLHDYWSKRWHQLLRQTFLTSGGYPAEYLTRHAITLVGGSTKSSQRLANTASKIALVLGTFAASGFFHSLALYAMGGEKGTSHEVTFFFVMQGVAVIGERVWRNVTGRRVGGWIGMGWTYAVILIGGQRCINEMHVRGLGGGMVIPPPISPTRQILFPMLSRLAETLSH